MNYKQNFTIAKPDINPDVLLEAFNFAFVRNKVFHESASQSSSALVFGAGSRNFVLEDIAQSEIISALIFDFLSLNFADSRIAIISMCTTIHVPYMQCLTHSVAASF